MKNDIQNRVIQIFSAKYEEWIQIPFNKLKDGDTFRIFDDEERYIDSEGNKVWIAKGRPYKNEEGIYCILTYKTKR